MQVLIESALFKVQFFYSKNALLIDSNFIWTSFHSLSFVLSGIIPPPAKRVKILFFNLPQRRLTKMFASLFDFDWNPTTPEYSSRLCDSASFIADNAVDVGNPKTAGVGWSKPIRDDNDSVDVNEISVHRCWIIPAGLECVVPTVIFASTVLNFSVI